MKIGKMAWRIGDRVDLFEQIEWIRENKFEEVSFHAAPGVEGVWQGFCPFGKSEAEIERLREAVSAFEEADVHAPFAPYDTFLAVRNPRVLDTCLSELEMSIALADRIGAETVTIHADVSPSMARDPKARDMMIESLKRLGESAAKSDVLIGVELSKDYELVRETGFPNVGLTLDVGHMSTGNGAGYRDYGSIGGVIRAFSDRVFLMHMHDYDGTHDHLAVGKGNIDFEEIATALHAIGYKGGLCLEVSPDQNTPEEMVQSRDRLREIVNRTRPT
ncbi:MAG: sugar phosphate isomerase/epimerase [Planctomycetes bacterium]|nr:sugar phosphate isomerase/epimerase [Planctomycetota bacterium]